MAPPTGPPIEFKIKHIQYKSENRVPFPQNCIAGIRDPVDGEWVINRVEHQLDSSGLQTRCDAEVPNN